MATRSTRSFPARNEAHRLLRVGARQPLSIRDVHDRVFVAVELHPTAAFEFEENGHDFLANTGWGEEEVVNRDRDSVLAASGTDEGDNALDAFNPQLPQKWKNAHKEGSQGRLKVQVVECYFHISKEVWNEKTSSWPP